MLSFFFCSGTSGPTLSNVPARLVALMKRGLVATLFLLLTSNAFAVGLRGTYRVGPGERFSSLTAAGGFFQIVNDSGLQTNVTLLVTGDLTAETGTVPLRPIVSTSPLGVILTLTIAPSAATERLVTGAMTNGIQLTGADFVTIDGRFNGSGRFLRFRNTASGQPTFNLRQDANDNTLRNCLIEGASSGASAAVVVVGTSITGSVSGVNGGVTGNDNFKLLDCLIRDRSDAAGQPTRGFHCNSSAGAPNSGGELRGNEFTNWTSVGIRLNDETGSDWLIADNHFYYSSTTTNTAGEITAIEVAGQASAQNIVVARNSIGGDSRSAQGLWTAANQSAKFVGIQIEGIGSSAPGSGPVVRVSGNVVRNIRIPGGSSNTYFVGIRVAGQPIRVAITRNRIGDVSGQLRQQGTTLPAACGILNTSTAAGQVVSDNVIGPLTTSDNAILLSVLGILQGGPSSSALVSGNRVFGLNNRGNASALAPSVLYGILLNDGSSDVINNQVTLTNDAAPTAQPDIRGIADNSASAATTRVWYNSVLVGGQAPFGGLRSASAAYRRDVSATTDLRNNLFVNERDGSGPDYALLLNATGNITSNHNVLRTAQSDTIVGIGPAASRLTYSLVQWQSASGGQDQNSRSVRVRFVDPAVGDLSLDPRTNCLVDNIGGPLPVSGINGEYGDSLTVRGTTPDPGADEFAHVPQAGGFAGTPPPSLTGPGQAALPLNVAPELGPHTLTYVPNGGAPVSATATGTQLVVPMPATFPFTYRLTTLTDAYGCALVLSAPTDTITIRTPLSVAEAAGAPAALAVWPNPVPAGHALHLMVPTAVAVPVLLRDLSGRLCWQTVLPAAPADAERTLVLPTWLPAGAYVLTMKPSAGTARHARLLKE